MAFSFTLGCSSISRSNNSSSKNWFSALEDQSIATQCMEEAIVYCVSCESDIDAVVDPYSWNDAEALLFVYRILKSRESFSATARRAVLPSISALAVGEHDFSIEFVCANFAL